MPTEGRDITGWLFSRDHPHSVTEHGLHVGIGGAANDPGKILLQAGKSTVSAGQPTIERWTWNQLILVRSPKRIRLYLNNHPAPEIDVPAVDVDTAIADLFLGGRSDNRFNWEGRIDEVAVFDRVLSESEIRSIQQSGE